MLLGIGCAVGMQTQGAPDFGESGSLVAQAQTVNTGPVAVVASRHPMPINKEHHAIRRLHQ